MKIKIAVAGDVSVDWYYWPGSSYSNKENVNLRLYEGLDTNPQPGGAILLAEWLRDILQIRRKESHYSLTSQSCENLVKKSPSEVLHTNIYMDLFPLFPSNDNKEEVKVYRVKNCLGHITPDDKRQYPVPLEILEDEENSDIVIVYDEGSSFRFEEKVWPTSLKGDSRPIVIYNMHPPLFQGNLWNHIIKYYKQNLILILNADDLRKIGTNISRSISWEKSAIEFLWEISHKEDLAEIRELSNIITLFNYDGAIHYKGKTDRSKLYFDPESPEGDFWNSKKFGYMRATNLMFISNLSACLISKFMEKNTDSQKGDSYQTCIENSVKEGLEEGLKEALIKSREFLINGFGNSNGKPDFFKHSCLNITQKNRRGSVPDQSNLSQSNLSQSNLSRSNLSQSNLSQSNLSQSNLSQSNLSQSNLSQSNLSQSNLSQSNLSQSNLSQSNLSQSNLSQSKSPKSHAGHIADTFLPSIEEIDEHSDSRQSNQPNSHFWTILKEKIKEESSKESGETSSTYLEKLAFLIVKKGFSSVKDFPVGKFGKLTTVDRTEIESFRSIKNIIGEYINSQKNRKPLSIAVFGSPGSGKSFGVTEVAESIDSEGIEKITFNISQFTSTRDLANAFHRIRDISLKGKVPLVFFDEFDSKFNDEELGWIKYFLVPMQDGEFLDLESMHPIGKSIFVFAGSTYNSFKEFFDFCSYLNKQSKSYTETDPSRKISNKCPDFLSRLRGYVNILGLNRANEEDETHIIRRAIQLRSLIEASAPKIIKDNYAHVGRPQLCD